MASYANRAVDFLAAQNVQATGDNQLELALFSPTSSGYICAGVQKLAQRWLIEFMTEVGSMPGLPTRGTNFMTLVRSGSIRTTAAMTLNFNFAAVTAKTNLANEETNTWPDDERIAGVELLSLEFSPGSAKLYVIVYSRAGNAREVLLPVDTLSNNVL
jgi:hypothetical protein